MSIALLDTLLEDRWRRPLVGKMPLVLELESIPAVVWFPSASSNAPDAVDEEMLAVLATLAECARNADSSRVNLLTTASCSFSSSRCISAAVMGRGCRMGADAASA